MGKEGEAVLLEFLISLWTSRHPMHAPLFSKGQQPSEKDSFPLKASPAQISMSRCFD